MKIHLNSREFLWKLEAEAKLAEDIAANSMWESVYRRLAEVVCELDAYIARSTETKMFDEEIEEGK